MNPKTLEDTRAALISQYQTKIDIIKKELGKKKCSHPITDYDDRYADYFCVICCEIVE